MNNFEEGTNAPDFKLPGSDGKEHSLSDYLGKIVVLYFYLKDSNPICSIEAKSFRENCYVFRNLDAVIIGVSRDTSKSHEKLAAKLCLPFVLLSDTDSNVCEMYGVLREKISFGKRNFDTERSTFIIDKEGKIIKIYRNVKIDGHVDEILDLLRISPVKIQ